MTGATWTFYSNALEHERHQAFLRELCRQAAARHYSKYETVNVLTEGWALFTFENYPDDATDVDFSACAARFINDHWVEGRYSAFDIAVQATLGVGVGLFRLAVSGVMFLVAMGALAVGCLALMN